MDRKIQAIKSYVIVDSRDLTMIYECFSISEAKKILKSYSNAWFDIYECKVKKCSIKKGKSKK